MSHDFFLLSKTGTVSEMIPKTNLMTQGQKISVLSNWE